MSRGEQDLWSQLPRVNSEGYFLSKVRQGQQSVRPDVHRSLLSALGPRVEFFAFPGSSISRLPGLHSCDQAFLCRALRRLQIMCRSYHVLWLDYISLLARD